MVVQSPIPGREAVRPQKALKGEVATLILGFRETHLAGEGRAGSGRSERGGYIRGCLES